MHNYCFHIGVSNRTTKDRIMFQILVSNVELNLIDDEIILDSSKDE